MSSTHFWDQEFEKYFALIPYDPSSYLTPENLIREKETFLKSQKSNPVFRYQKFSVAKIVKARKILLALQIDSSPAGFFYTAKKQELLLKLDFLAAIGTEKFSAAAAALYPLSRKSEVAADLLKSSSEEKKGEKISAKKAQDIIADFFLRLALPWKIVLSSSMVTRGLVEFSNQTLFLKKETFFRGEADLWGFIAHEVEGHVFRFANGEKQEAGLFKFGFANYLETEEGLAVYNRLRLLKLAARKRTEALLALRKQAIFIASQKSFRETFEELFSLTANQKLAFDLTLRAKRGFSDTGLAGAGGKDLVYLAGLHKIRKFLDNKGKLQDLYLGRLPCEQIALIKKVFPKLKSPFYLPSWLKN